MVEKRNHYLVEPKQTVQKTGNGCLEYLPIGGEVDCSAITGLNEVLNQVTQAGVEWKICFHVHHLSLRPRHHQHTTRLFLSQGA